MTIYFVLFKCIGNCTYWYCVNYSNTARCIIARVLYTFIFGFTDKTLLGGIQMQQLASEPIKFNSSWTLHWGKWISMQVLETLRITWNDSKSGAWPRLM